MSNLDTALLIVLCLNAFLFMGQVALLSINPGAAHYFNCKDTTIGQLEASNCQSASYSINDQNPGSKLPEGQSGVSATTGNIFTDTFAAAKSWLLDSTGLSYVITILSAPTSMLKMMGLPTAFSFAVGVIWYGLTFFFIVAWLVARL